MFEARVSCITGMTLMVDKSAMIASAAVGEVTFIKLPDLNKIIFFYKTSIDLYFHLVGLIEFFMSSFDFYNQLLGHYRGTPIHA